MLARVGEEIRKQAGDLWIFLIREVLDRALDAGGVVKTSSASLCRRPEHLQAGGCPELRGTSVAAR